MTDPDPVAVAVAALIAALQATQPNPEPAPQEMLTVREAAEYLRCSESLVYGMLKDGRIHGVRIGRRRLIAMSEIRRITEGDEP
ncbi:DNA-binding protein [Mycobacteroides abscessus subsp. abscessus]|uniref:helix-turn-helix domain-containing protein n=1 Tax=Mycobacteroides abscessus TaxID=36809 RepID=UPI000927EBE8|nr:helix-turn-helix domain-containing protein [Mycobacteroides abscessus]SHX68829.1 DNA-binding protein [Mycobacteroides abscessus subsp. abscessus]SIC57547.1 DNA-binding protein [Mycobacteroides abscessus subsp. abscessus]SKK19303.1 DNA-binding protein [Mycobacteroides abscessus subsp. abscessus]SKP48672.1 DNA-binding protein [Mycobacteroides abscessus subsp. abscessus]